MSTRWIGDLSTCFLLADGWAFRLKVNRFQLKGKPGWQMPLSVADALGLEPGEFVELPCANGSVSHVLRLERRRDALVGGEFEVPLRHLDCKPDDLAFVAFRHDCYSVTARHRSELEPQDALGSLLWHSGFDPTDGQLRASPWDRLARALGGSGDRPDDVADRLTRRSDKRLLALLEAAASQVKLEGDQVGWSKSWQLTLPDQDEAARFALQRSDGCIHVALGVLDGTTQAPGAGVTLGLGETLWATLGPADELETVERLLQHPPGGLFPSGERASWVRWMRADHAGRRAALLGNEWQVDRLGSHWRLNGTQFPDLPAALLTLRDASPDPAPAPVERPTEAYPRSGLAFSNLVEATAQRGLRGLTGRPGLGYVAEFSGGETTRGVTLVDVLARS